MASTCGRGRSKKHTVIFLSILVRSQHGTMSWDNPNLLDVSKKGVLSFFALQKNCILTYRGGLGASGTYVVTLTLEDFPAGTTNFNNIRPFSAVPLQFLVIIGVGSGSCQDTPVFTASTPQNGECSEIQIGSVYKAVIEVRLPNIAKQ